MSKVEEIGARVFFFHIHSIVNPAKSCWTNSATTG